jgi:hypothetical protein
MNPSGPGEFDVGPIKGGHQAVVLLLTDARIFEQERHWHPRGPRRWENETGGTSTRLRPFENQASNRPRDDNNRAENAWCGAGEILGFVRMRMRGLEPPRGFPHTDLNRARLPIPPHPRGAADDDSNGSVAKLDLPEPPSSRGLGRRPLTAETGVRIPVAVLRTPRAAGLSSFRPNRIGRQGPRRTGALAARAVSPPTPAAGRAPGGTPRRSRSRRDRPRGTAAAGRWPRSSARACGRPGREARRACTCRR